MLGEDGSVLEAVAEVLQLRGVSRQGADQLLRCLLEGCPCDGLQQLSSRRVSNVAPGMGSPHEDDAG